MSEQDKCGKKWVTSIVIGGALGSFATWVFGNKKRREIVGGKMQEYYQNTKENLERVFKNPEPPHHQKKQAWWRHLFQFFR